jgi:hypothetical protein
MSRTPGSPRSRRSRIRIVIATIIGSVTILAVLLVFTFIRNNRPPNIVIPTPPMPPVNAYYDFLRAAQMAGAIPHKSPASMLHSPTTRAGLLAATKACTLDSALALAVMRQGFDKPCMLPPIRKDWGLDMMHALAQFRELARTISGVVMYYELSGQPGKAVDIALDGVEFAVMVPHGGGSIADSSSSAYEEICLYRLEKLLPQLSPVELSRTTARLERIAAKRVPYSEIVLEEGREYTAMLQQSFKDPNSQGLKSRYDMAQLYIQGVGNDHRPTARESWEMFQFSMSNKTAMLQANLDYFNKLAVEVRQPYTGTSKVPVLDNAIGKMNRDLVAIQGRQHHLAKQAVLDLLRIQVALYRFRAANGRYPASLQEMVPAFLKSIPMDPFGQGKPYVYKYIGSSFLLYSVGVDMKDDGGKPAKYHSEPGGDIVSGQLFHAKPLPAK